MKQDEVLEEFMGELWKLALQKARHQLRTQTHGMLIQEALTMMNEAIPRLVDQESVVYPGLTAIQAVKWLMEGFLPTIRGKSPQMHVHPMVAERIMQVSNNRIPAGRGPGPDPKMARLYFLAHPDEDVKITITRETKQIEAPAKPGKRRFL